MSATEKPGSTEAESSTPSEKSTAQGAPPPGPKCMQLAGLLMAIGYNVAPERVAAWSSEEALEAAAFALRPMLGAVSPRLAESAPRMAPAHVSAAHGRSKWSHGGAK